uniref:Uncharacterized protein n=1 Tax=Amphimedon queenslandica TaxID=400682 RepID=A0A1X7SEL1_AMPQE
LNYQNTNGKNALMLTSEGGHIEVFESLLLNGADPFVQLRANKGCIGLNSLACTALSEHVYKSIGGEKIMPQDGISVEDMLDMAVKERGLLQPHYSCLNINLLTIPCNITEPIKEQVEDYNANLKIFKDTTSLLELAMITKGYTL